MDTSSRLMHRLFQQVPRFFKKKLVLKESRFSQDYQSAYSLFASTTNLSHHYHDESVYDTDGCLLYTQTAQSNLSLFNVSCESLILDDTHDQVKSTLKRTKHSTSSMDIPNHIKKAYYRSTMIFDDQTSDASNGTLQRWQVVDLAHTSDE